MCYEASSALWYHGRDRTHMLQTESITGTSTRTPTTVASAAGLFAPNNVIATATANSKKLLAPIRAPWCGYIVSDVEKAHQPISQSGIEVDLDEDWNSQKHDCNPVGQNILGLKCEDQNQRCQVAQRWLLA